MALDNMGKNKESNRTNKKNLIIIASKFESMNSIIEANFKHVNHELIIVNSPEEFENLVDKYAERIKVIFLFHWSKILEPKLLTNYKVIGFHTGDLPQGRGGSPIQNHILRKMYATYICSFQVVNEVDEGPVYQKVGIDLSNGTILEIIQRNLIICCKMASDFLVEDFAAIPQADSRAILKFNRLQAEDSRIPTNLDSLEDLHDRIRMVDGFDYPKAFIEFGDFRIEFDSSALEGENLKAKVRIWRKHAK